MTADVVTMTSPLPPSMAISVTFVFSVSLKVSRAPIPPQPATAAVVATMSVRAPARRASVGVMPQTLWAVAAGTPSVLPPSRPRENPEIASGTSGVPDGATGGGMS